MTTQGQMTTEEILAVIQDFKNGYRIQRRIIGKNQWINVDSDSIEWDFSKYQYCSKKITGNVCVNVSLSTEELKKLNEKLDLLDETVSGHFKNELKKLILNFLEEK